MRNSKVYSQFILIVLLLGLTSISSFAEVRLAKVFNNHMVLQRDIPIPVWGWADKGEKVVVSFKGKEYPVLMQ